MDFPKHVRVCDVGPRDGLQNEQAPISTDDKVRMVDELIAAGVPQVEFGSFVSPTWVPRMADSEEVFSRVNHSLAARLIALVPNEKGYQRARAAGVPAISLVAGPSETFQKKNLNMTVAENMRLVETIAAQAKADGVWSAVAFSTSWGCPYEGHVNPAMVVELAARAFQAGAEQVSFADTTGMADPRHVQQLLAMAKRAGIPVERTACHFHNTRGAGLADVLAALGEGISSFDSSLAGLGGCPFAPRATGNICTEDLVHMLHAMGIGTGIVLPRLLDTSRWIECVIGRALPGQVAKAGLAFPELAGAPAPDAAGEG